MNVKITVVPTTSVKDAGWCPTEGIWLEQDVDVGLVSVMEQFVSRTNRKWDHKTIY